MIKCEACRAFDRYFATSLNCSILQEHECKVLFITRHKKTPSFGVKTSSYCRLLRNAVRVSLRSVTKSSNLSILLHGVISLTDAASYGNKGLIHGHRRVTKHIGPLSLYLLRALRRLPRLKLFITCLHAALKVAT